MPAKKITPQQVETPYSPNDLAYWMGRVDAGLVDMKNVFEQYMRSNEQNWSDERQWRTCVDKALAELDKRLLVLEKYFENRDDPGDEDQSQVDIADKAVTWKWLVEKLGVPILTALTIWLLLTFFPSLIKSLP